MAKRIPLLIAGAAAVALAQIGLYFSVELNTKAPAGYLLLLSLGVGLSALGSFGLWYSRSAKDQTPARSSSMPTGLALAGLRPSYRIASPCTGGVLVALLLILLAAGWESGSALLLWLLAPATFVAVVWPSINAPQILSRSAFTALFRRYRWDAVAVFGLTGVFLTVNLWDLQHWYYSAIGDEYLFCEHAIRIIDEGIVRPFSQEGVYNKPPVLTSVIQATAMRVFGVDYFGWTFSETLNAALTIPAVYVLGRNLGGRTAGVVAAGIFAFSHYIFAFSHTGYANLSSLPVTAWALALLLIGWRKGNPSFCT